MGRQGGGLVDTPPVGPDGPYQPLEGTDFSSRVRSVQDGLTVAAPKGSENSTMGSATFTTISEGTKVELNGVFVLEFDTSKRCALLREWWHAR